MRRTARSTARARAAAVAGVLVALLTVLGSALALGGPASAEGGSLLVDVPGDGVGFSHDPGHAILDVPRLYPGGSGSGVVDVRNTSSYDATLSLAIVDLRSDENGCVRPERRQEGEGCEAGGELADWLEVTVTREDAGDRQAGEQLWRGGMRELAAGADLPMTLPAGATGRLRLTVALPQETPNDTMTDSVEFGTRLTATGEAGESTVSGPQVDVAGPSDQPGSTSGGGAHVPLPMTGGTVSLWMLLLDAAVLAVGASLVWAGWLRPSRAR